MYLFNISVYLRPSIETGETLLHYTVLHYLLLIVYIS